MSYINRYSESLDDALGNILGKNDKDEKVFNILAALLILYAAFGTTYVPFNVLVLMDNVYVRILLLCLIAFAATKNAKIAILAAICFIVSIQALNRVKTHSVITTAVLNNKEHFDQQMNNFHMTDVKTNDPFHDPSHPVYIPEEALAPLQEFQEERVPNAIPEEGVVSEGRPGELAFGQAGCTQIMDHRNSFYPQYVNASQDAYNARYTGSDVGGFDPEYRQMQNL
jgi:hypothetical protein